MPVTDESLHDQLQKSQARNGNPRIGAQPTLAEKLLKAVEDPYIPPARQISRREWNEARRAAAAMAQGEAR